LGFQLGLLKRPGTPRNEDAAEGAAAALRKQTRTTPIVFEGNSDSRVSGLGGTFNVVERWKLLELALNAIGYLPHHTLPADVPRLSSQVRKKIGDIQASFPAGVQSPYFNDEFGDVFGIVYAFTADGFTLPQLKHVVEDAREQLLSVPGIGKVDLLGKQDKRI
jgi:hypothetical protein